MACTKGRANPTAQTKLRLFADSAGFCQRPQCRQPLFSERDGADIHIAEMAHIFAAADGGPRVDVELSDDERRDYDNLILLCANCHTTVDKAPEEYPDNMILDWKQRHAQLLRETFGVVEFGDRAHGRVIIEPLLIANRKIFDQYGPHNDYGENPEAEEARVWKRKMLAQIIPNNRTILLHLDANRGLLAAEEVGVVEAFRQHIDDLIEKHLGEGKAIATRFPAGMNTLFE